MIVTKSERKPLQASSNSDSRLQTKSINFRSLSYGLQIIIKGHQDLEKKKQIQKIFIEFKQSADPKQCRNLDESSYLQLTKIRSFIKFFRLAFIDLTNHVRQYFKYQNTNIIETIVQFQLQLDVNNLKQTYLIQLNKLKLKLDWSDKFVEDWFNKALQLQSKEKLPFQNGFKSELGEQNQTNSFKRDTPTQEQSETPRHQAPKKKLKKDSLNYKSVIKALETMIRYSRDNQRQQLQSRMEKYQQTEDGQYLRIKNVDICRKLFDLRSYMKHFADAFVQITNKDQYRSFADKEMLLKIFEIQEYIDPSDILISYKRIILKKQEDFGWTKELVKQWIEKVIQLKKKQIEILSKRN